MKRTPNQAKTKSTALSFRIIQNHALVYHLHPPGATKTGSGKGVDHCLNAFAKFSLTFIFIKNRVYVIVYWSVLEQSF